MAADVEARLLYAANGALAVVGTPSLSPTVTSTCCFRPDALPSISIRTGVQLPTLKWFLKPSSTRPIFIPVIESPANDESSEVAIAATSATMNAHFDGIRQQRVERSLIEHRRVRRPQSLSRFPGIIT